MTDHDPALIEKAEREGWRAYKEGGGVEDVARAVLDAVADDLRAAAWDEGWEAAWSPMSMHNLNDGPNPYRKADGRD